MSERLRIVLADMLLAAPLGGLTWSVLQFLGGLSQLGHEVWFVEDRGESWYYDPRRDVTDGDPSYALEYAGRALDGLGLGDRWALHDDALGWLGPAAGRIRGVARSADLLVTRAGSHKLREWMLDIPARALVDMDPGIVQVGHLQRERMRELAAHHTAHFTIGERIGRGADVPDDGFAWRPTRHPIVLDAVPVSPGRPGGRFTTVMHWDSFGEIVHEGRRYGMKSATFAPYENVPARCPGERFELAVGGPTRPPARLGDRGWTVTNALDATWSVDHYLSFIAGSKAEFTTAKEAYVATACGWFSERSATYLAAGRPVVVHDTGFRDHLPVGEGLLAFSTPDEAVAAVHDVAGRYDVHCRRAREVAEECFDARRILADLVAAALEPVPHGAAR